MCVRKLEVAVTKHPSVSTDLVHCFRSLSAESVGSVDLGRGERGAVVK